MEIALFSFLFIRTTNTHSYIFTAKYSQLIEKTPNVKDCKCEISHSKFVRIHLVSNFFKQKNKLGGRHRYVMDILKRAGLAKALSHFVIQIVALTRAEERRRRKIDAELQPDYVHPEKKTKSKDTTTTSSNSNNKRKKARTTKPLGAHNVPDDESMNEFIVDDDSDESDGGWDSEASEDEEEELEDTTASDIEFEEMMIDSDDESFSDINIDSDLQVHEDGTGDVVLGCICGRPHDHDLPSDKLFWIRCDNCDEWYHVSADCTNFDKITAETLDSWRCPSCATQDSHE